MNLFYSKCIKRSLDFIFSLLGLILLLPIFIIIGSLIKVDTKGPIFFKQKRIGRNGDTFEIYKFRTMVVNAEQMGTGLSIRSLNDNRITKVGSFLRNTSLDELPQLYNILMGEMSIIGPRPPVTYFPYKGFKNYPEYSKKRFKERPGVTGLAQVVYRNNAAWDNRFELDNKYVDGISFLLDLKILLLTIYKILKRENVYGEMFLDKNKED